MSNAPQSKQDSRFADSGTAEEVRFEAETEWPQIERAVDESEFASAEVLIREASLQFAADLVDEASLFRCPRDGCEESFATERELRGHLGSSVHALDVPDGEFWCGVCGRGPFTWRGVNAHHGSSPSHEDDPIHLDEEPDPEDLVAPRDVPDHKNPQLLEDLYEEHNGTITELYRAHDFDVHMGTVRDWLIKYDIHQVTPHGNDETDDVPEYRNRDRLKELYERHDGNVSELHRQEELDVSYRGLLNWLKKLDIHDPAGRQGSEYTDEDAAAGAEAENADAEEEDSTPEPPTTTTEDDEPPAGEGDAGDAEDEESQFDESYHEIIVGDAPADADSFDDLKTPDWLTEASFHIALDMSEDAEALAENLGWGDPNNLQKMVDLLGCDEKFEEVETDV